MMGASLFRKPMRLALAAVSLVVPLAPPALAAPHDGVKAAMIYNILRFMTLPEAHAKVRLCLRRSEDIVPDLLALSGEPLGAGHLEVVPLASLDAAHGCDVIYTGSAGAAGLVAGHGQVLIGDGNHFVDDGGTVGLVSFGGQVRFAINMRTAAKGGIRVNSQLMRLAARVVN